MSTSHLFQDFGTLKPANAEQKSMSVEDIEDVKLHAFEGGFQAGWEEALKAQSKTLTHVSDDLAESLRSASLEYGETRQTLQTAVEAIMSEVVETVLPLTARSSLGTHICELVKTLSQDALNRSIEITLAPGRDEVVQKALSDELTEPFKLVVDPMMSPNQVCLRVGSKEIDLNLDRTVAEIASAVADFFETRKTEVKDG